MRESESELSWHVIVEKTKCIGLKMIIKATREKIKSQKRQTC